MPNALLEEVQTTDATSEQPEAKRPDYKALHNRAILELRKNLTRMPQLDESCPEASSIINNARTAVHSLQVSIAKTDGVTTLQELETGDCDKLNAKLRKDEGFNENDALKPGYISAKNAPARIPSWRDDLHKRELSTAEDPIENANAELAQLGRSLQQAIESGQHKEAEALANGIQVATKALSILTQIRETAQNITT
jgi:hypothetical protein